jgi:hypothetical protein
MVSDKDDKDWIDLLAGQSVPDADPKIVRETQILRAALLSHADKPKNESDIPYPDILENVLARLESENLTQSQKPSGLKKWWMRLNQFKSKLNFEFPIPNYKPAFAVVVSLLVAIIVIPPLISRNTPKVSDIPEIPSDSMRVRGNKRCLNKIFTSQPKMLALQKQNELEALGITIDSLTKVGDEENKWRLKATLPAIKSKEIEAFLIEANVELGNHPDYLCFTFLSQETE